MATMKVLVNGEYVELPYYAAHWYAGEADLNLAVVGGTSAPSNPVENTVWVNTATAISDWQFTAKQPDKRTDGTPLGGGEVWFQTGINSKVEFNALKKYGITISPNACMQYIGGEWVDVVTMSYQNGAWVEWYDGELFKNGRQYTDITGGWSENGYMYYRASYVRDAPTIGDTILVDASKMIGSSTTTTSIAGTQKAIDVTDKTTLSMNVISVTGTCYLVVTGSSKDTYPMYTKKSMSITTTGNVKLDISDIEGEAFIAVVAVRESGTNRCEVNEIRLA